MRERGRVQIQFMKTRSSSGAGQKVDLDFNVESLRIIDLDEDAEDSETVTSSALYKKLAEGGAGAKSAQSSANNTGMAVDSGDRLKAILRRQE